MADRHFFPHAAPHSSPMKRPALELRLEALARSIVSEAEMSPPAPFLAAVHARGSARLTMRWTLVASAAASLFLTTLLLYALLPRPVAPPLRTNPVAARPANDSGAEPDAQPTLGKLTQKLTADPSAPLPALSTSPSPDSEVVKAGDSPDSPVAKDLQNHPRR